MCKLRVKIQSRQQHKKPQDTPAYLLNSMPGGEGGTPTPWVIQNQPGQDINTCATGNEPKKWQRKGPDDLTGFVQP